MTVDNKKVKRKPGGGRKKSKPDYSPSAILQNQMDAAVLLYDKEEHPSLQTIADELDLNPIKVRKLLITAGVYKSEVADQVNRVFNQHRASGLSHTETIAATMKELNLSKASVTSYLPYEKCVYFPAETDNKNLSVGAERIRRMRKREKALEELKAEQSEEALWAAVIAFQGYKFRTYSGLVFSYSLKKGRCRGNAESGVANKQDKACKQDEACNGFSISEIADLLTEYGRKTKLGNSKDLIRLLYRSCKWKNTMSYRIQGTGFPEQQTVNFNLDDALELNEMKRTTKAEGEA